LCYEIQSMHITKYVYKPGWTVHKPTIAYNRYDVQVYNWPSRFLISFLYGLFVFGTKYGVTLPIRPRIECITCFYKQSCSASCFACTVDNIPARPTLNTVQFLCAMLVRDLSLSEWCFNILYSWITHCQTSPLLQWRAEHYLLVVISNVGQLSLYHVIHVIVSCDSCHCIMWFMSSNNTFADWQNTHCTQWIYVNSQWMSVYNDRILSDFLWIHSECQCTMTEYSVNFFKKYTIFI